MDRAYDAKKRGVWPKTVGPRRTKVSLIAMRLPAASFIAVVLCCAVPSPGSAAHGSATPARFSVGYGSEQALEHALAREPGLVLRRVSALRVAEVRSAEPGFASRLRALP